MTPDIPVTIQVTVDVGRGVVRGVLTEESERVLEEGAPVGPAGQYTREYEVPFSGPGSSLPEKVAEVLGLFQSEYGDIDFTVGAACLGVNFFSLDKVELEMMAERAGLSMETDTKTVECPDCGRVCFTDLTVCPDCGCNLCQEEAKGGRTE